VDHWIYQDAEYFKVWFEMLYRARYLQEPATKLIHGQLVTIKRGEFVFGRKSWSERLGISEQRLRTLIKRLVQDNMIELVKRYNKFTIYKVVNYEKYNQQGDQHEILENQYLEGDSNQQVTTKKPYKVVNYEKYNQQDNQQEMLENQHLEGYNNQQVTTKQPPSNQQLTTKEESNKDKNVYKYIVEYLNEKANKNFRPTTKKTQSLINARIREGFTLDDFKKVIDIKCSQWLDTEMEKYLRPETLFGTKFESYLNEKSKVDKPPTPDNWRRSDRRL
jgi:uncharacterized phage protein (TIGR02220 family)